MNRHLHSPTKLTEFARDFEEEPETFFSKFVNKITNAYNTSYNTVNELPISSSSSVATLVNCTSSQNTVNSNSNSNNSNNNNHDSDDVQNISRENSMSSVNSPKQGGQQLKVTSTTDKSTSESMGSTSEDTSESNEKYDDLPIENNEGRTMVNILKRISNIVAAKNNNLRNYKDTELHRFWMPDSKAKECYDCCQKFSAFRRKHHCRLCGQIFCSKCCNQVVPGKIIMCSGTQ